MAESRKVLFLVLTPDSASLLRRLAQALMGIPAFAKLRGRIARSSIGLPNTDARLVSDYRQPIRDRRTTRKSSESAREATSFPPIEKDSKMELIIFLVNLINCLTLPI